MTTQRSNGGALPDSTPVSQMGLTPGEAALLTPSAQKLTKGDLMSLTALNQANRNLREDVILNEFNERFHQNLSIKDIHSLQDAFAARAHRLSTSPVTQLDSACCCCTCCPCCSCTASVVTAPVVSRRDQALGLR